MLRGGGDDPVVRLRVPDRQTDRWLDRLTMKRQERRRGLQPPELQVSAPARTTHPGWYVELGFRGSTPRWRQRPRAGTSFAASPQASRRSCHQTQRPAPSRRRRPLPRAGWISTLLLEWLRSAVQPPGSTDSPVSVVRRFAMSTAKSARASSCERNGWDAGPA